MPCSQTFCDESETNNLTAPLNASEITIHNICEATITFTMLQICFHIQVSRVNSIRQGWYERKGGLWRVTTLKWHSKHGVCLVSRCRLGWSRASDALIIEFTCESLQDTNSWTICTREPSRDSRSVLTCHHTRVFTPQNTIRRCTLKRTTLINQFKCKWVHSRVSV